MTLTSKIRKNKEISELKDILFKSPVLLFFHLNTLEGIDWLSFKKDLNAFTLTYNVPNTHQKPFANTIDAHCETGLNPQRCYNYNVDRLASAATTETSPISSSNCYPEVRQAVGTPAPLGLFPRAALAAPDREPHTACVVLKTKVVKNTLLNVLLSKNTGFKGFKGPTLVVYCAPKAIASFAEHTLYNMSALRSERANGMRSRSSSYSVDNNILLHACTGIIQQFLQSISVIGTPNFKHTLIQSNMSNCSKSVKNTIQQYVALQNMNTNVLHSSADLLRWRYYAPLVCGAPIVCKLSDQSNDVGKGDAKLIPLGLFFTQYNKYVPISAPNFERFDYETALCSLAAPAAHVQDTTKSSVSAGESQAYATAYFRCVANSRYSLGVAHLSGLVLHMQNKTRHLTAEQQKQQDHNAIDYKYELARIYDISKFPTIYYQMQLVLPPSLLCVPQQHLIKSLISNFQALSIIDNPMRKLLQILSFYQKIM